MLSRARSLLPHLISIVRTNTKGSFVVVLPQLNERVGNSSNVFHVAEYSGFRCSCTNVC